MHSGKAEGKTANSVIQKEHPNFLHFHNFFRRKRGKKKKKKKKFVDVWLYGEVFEILLEPVKRREEILHNVEPLKITFSFSSKWGGEREREREREKG